MDFNLQTYQAEQVLHLSAKGERRLMVQQNSDYRWLEIDGVVQSVMPLIEPTRLCLPHQHVIAWLLPAQAEQILELGLGGGDLTRYLQQRWPLAQHQCVELDEEVLTLYRHYFQPPAQQNTAAITLHHADALIFLEQSDQHYDLILLDLFSQDGNPPQLFQERLYQALAPRLIGPLLINLLPRTVLELNQALQLIEQWIGPATPYPVPGFINVIVHVMPRDTASLDL
ncbi:spermidine synthase [Aeromonas cavernicola]|uniref:SAM-dependent methyltransferase n=1 Tax=Aeromonas cavernicola TaxID=1006623 RepID=A0A2H9U190_9GAMM|nr:methyltransferase domain-containing protein [Aeromonas cavernicola]PJG57773.1 SAM-dependent methyltransferase [Aeromonas cavernicola]